ncbi:probable cytochrome P450 4aa1 [Chrysoperla carnea]|uniref:probable cytochrome P450 4aa1 n=1 Tax=Chrysoperla carnea TaxID=189513 RepID=UPI001D076EDC|nr:probable cytochrome P450 4aa1 [Chrysoperla carnea]
MVVLLTKYTNALAWDTILLGSFLIGICIYTFKLLYHWFRAVCLALRLKGPPALPIIGNALIAIDSNCINTIGRTAVEQYGRIIRGWITIIPCIVLADPENIQAVLASPKHTGKAFIYRLLHNFLGEGLITNTGAKWKQHRKLIQPIFTNNILESFIDTFSDSAQSLLTKLSAHSGQDINITSYINNCVLDILNEAVLGVPINNNCAEDIGESPFRKGEIVAPYRLVRPWLLFNWIYELTEVARRELEQKQNLNNFTKKMIEYNKNIDKTKCSGRKSLLAMFQEIAERHPNFTEHDIVQEICTFMLAGQDSVGSALAFCLYSLAKHQEHQDIVIKELDTIFKDSSRSPNARDLDEMCYLEQCIKETLRLYPSVPLVARKISEDIKLNDKYTIPKNCTVFISPYFTQRLPDIYPDPDNFIPSRFSREEILKRHPYSFIPFSAGPRNCIGYKFSIMEMKTVISTILRHYRITLSPGKENLTLSWRITIRARGGIWLRLIPRTS